MMPGVSVKSVPGHRADVIAGICPLPPPYRRRGLRGGLRRYTKAWANVRRVLLDGLAPENSVR